MPEKHILTIFTFKSDQALSDVLKKYNLASSSLQAKITAKFMNEELAEKDLAALLQKEASIPIQTAQQVAKDIMTLVVPTIKKMSEEELTRLSEDAKDELIFGKTQKKEEKKFKPESNIPKLRQPLGVEKALQERQAQALKEKVIGQPVENEPMETTAPKRRSRLPKKQFSETPAKQSSKPKKADSYREPIE